MRVLNTAQMREADRRTIDDLGVPSLELMENAGRQVVSAIESRWPSLRGGGRITVICGKGNNGGDGLVVARLLAALGVAVRACLAAPESAIGGDAATNLAALRAAGVPVVDVSTPAAWAAVRAGLDGCDLVVDALFGTGLTRGLAGHWETVVADIEKSGATIVSIDLPSGLSADEPGVIGKVVKATLTITLAAPKLPLLLAPASLRAGDVVVADIGIPTAVVDALPGPRVTVITRAWARRQVRPRHRDTHKGDYGRVLIAAGSPGKTGAAGLAALGALRSGAGLVTVATPRVCQPTVAAFAPEYMTLGLDHGGEGLVGAEAASAVLAERCDVLAVGPGLGLDAGVARFVRELVDRATVRMVLDADALNVFASDLAGLKGRPDRPLVVTPHAGEMARLVGKRAEHVTANCLDVACEFACRQGVFVVLKGPRTVVATPTGDAWINVTGNPGMATGGTGDVLTGVLCAWIAQLADIETASALGVCLHGLAGDLAADDHGHAGLVASDLAHRLGPALTALADGGVNRHEHEPECRPL